MSHVLEELFWNVVMCHWALRLCLHVFLKSGMNSSRWNLCVGPTAASPSPPPPPAPPLPLPLTQSACLPGPEWPIPARHWCRVLPISPRVAGWRRWRASGAPPTRFLCELQPDSSSRTNRMKRRHNCLSLPLGERFHFLPIQETTDLL